MDISGLLELELFLNGTEISSARKIFFENASMREVRSKIFSEKKKAFVQHLHWDFIVYEYMFIKVHHNLTLVATRGFTENYTN